MKSTRRIRFAFLAAAVACATVAVGQKVARKAPTAEDWTALAKLPDFTGVWEIGLGGEAGGLVVAELPRRRDLLQLGAAPAGQAPAGRGGAEREGRCEPGGSFSHAGVRRQG